jgi:hypothetical protein
MNKIVGEDDIRQFAECAESIADAVARQWNQDNPNRKINAGDGVLADHAGILAIARYVVPHHPALPIYKHLGKILGEF